MQEFEQDSAERTISREFSEEAENYPTISKQQYEELLSLKTGPDSFIEFRGFVAGTAGPPVLKDIYRNHDSLTVLGKHESDFSLTLTGEPESGLGKKTLQEFKFYQLQMATGESPGIGYTIPAIFELKESQTLEQKSSAIELLQKITRDFMSTISGQAKLLSPDKEENETASLLSRYFRELKEKGIAAVFTREGFIDLEHEDIFRVQEMKE